MMTELKVQRILLATDFLESSRLALDYAVAIAHHFKATIDILHVLEFSQPAMEAELLTRRPSVSRKAAKGRIEALASAVRCTGIEVETYVEDGVPCEVILQAVNSHQANFLVLGVHGVHRGLGHLLIGSNTEKLLLSATCPTLTVGAHVLAGVDLSLHLNEILYFSDFTPEATAAAPYALLLGREFNVPVDVCQLVPEIAEHNPQLRQALAEEYCEAVRSVIHEAKPDWCTPNFQLQRGLELEQIINRAETQTAGLIVLGVHTQSQLGRHLHTSFAYQLLAKATCPILSIRG
jgi:nucleotide-binding universal stress UspA family protein